MPASPQPSAADAAQVERAMLDYLDAFNNLDWDRFVTFFASDVSVFHPDIPEAPQLHLVDGREAAEASFRAVFDQTVKTSPGPPYLNIVPEGLRVHLAGSTALATFVFQRGENSLGRRTFVWRKHPDGWKIVQIHASNVTSAGYEPMR